MKVYAVLKLADMGTRFGQPFRIQELVNVWEGSRKALEYIKANSDHTAGYYINVFDTSTGELTGLAEYRSIDGKMRRLKGAAVAF